MISFDVICEQSTPSSPIVFILSPGSDPASDVMKLAERSGFEGKKLNFLAMGQGQEKVLESFLLNFGAVLLLCMVNQKYLLSVVFIEGGSAVAGEGSVSWAVADAAELSSAC